MRKFNKFLTTFLATFMILFYGITPAVYAAEIDEVNFSEENQNFKMTKDKSYLLSYPVNGKGWQVSEIMFCIGGGVWLSFDENVENEYISIERLEESKPGTVQLMVRCKSFEVIGLSINLENTITGEKKVYSLAPTVVAPKPINYQVVVLEPESSYEAVSSTDEFDSLLPEDTKDPSSDETNTPDGDETDTPDDDADGTDTPDGDGDGTDTPDGDGDGTDTPDGDSDGSDDDNGDDTPAPIVIDTTGWSFEAITVVYDGTEYCVEVTGLPDYVTPVYTGNTRTNAGTNTAYVQFLVPEGYATPEGMETTITIEKAPIYIITDKNMVPDENGLKFSIPDGALPEGVTYTYSVNDVSEDGDFSITNTGSYIVNTEFAFDETFSEEMKQNYITDSSAIYNVIEHEDVTPSEYGLDFVLDLIQEKTENPNEVRITVNIHFPDPSGRNSNVTYKPVFDSSILTYVGSEVPDGMGGGKINAQGVVAGYTSNMGLLNDGTLTTFIFTVKEGVDIKNLPFMVTDVSGSWIAPDFTIDYSTSAPTSIILNPDVETDQYTVMLPKPSDSSSYSVKAQSTAVSTSVADSTDASSEVTDSVADSTDASTEVTDSVADSIDASSEVADNVADSTETSTEVTDSVADSTETSTEVTDSVADSTDASSEVADNVADSTDASSEVADNVADSTETSSEVTNSKDEN